MFERRVDVAESRELYHSDHLTLFICRQDLSLTLPPLDRCNGNMMWILPIGSTRVTLRTPDSVTEINDGSEATHELLLTGQNIYGLFAADCWLVTGLH